MKVNYTLLDEYDKANNDTEGELIMAVVKKALEVIGRDSICKIEYSFSVPKAIDAVCYYSCIGYWDVKRQQSFLGLPPDKRDVAIQMIRSVLGEDMYE